MSSNPVIDSNNKKEWRNERGQLHRIDGPALEWPDGTKEWWVDGKYHRLNGPAVEDSSGFKSWWVNGKLHRIDGPASEWADGYKEWWINGIKYIEQEYLNKINKLQIEVATKPKISRFKNLEIR